MIEAHRRRVHRPADTRGKPNSGKYTIASQAFGHDGRCNDPNALGFFGHHISYLYIVN